MKRYSIKPRKILKVMDFYFFAKNSCRNLISKYGQKSQQQMHLRLHLKEQFKEHQL